MNKRIFLLLQIVLLGISSLFAITKEEMEQAQATTALWYLRYVNDGSGYLEELTPKTVEELQQHLKSKEKENIKIFLNIPVPADYASWNKDKMVEYWSKTIFTNPDFPEKAQAAKRRIKNKLEAMEIAPIDAVQPTTANNIETSGNPSADLTDSIYQSAELTTEAESSEIATTEEQPYDEEIEIETKEGSNSTIIYIIILTVLVGIVVWLVVFALNTNKKNSLKEDTLISKSSMDKYIRELEKKDAEIVALKEKIQVLTIRLRSAESKLQEKGSSSTQQYTTRKVSSSQSITLYLGEVNTQGVFVRATKEFNPEQSIYKLITTDGVSGSFGVIHHASVFNQIKTKDCGLKNACTGNNIEDTGDADSISTVNAGTAIFENGKWRVIRKAEIKIS